MSTKFDFNRALHDFEFAIRESCMFQFLMHDLEKASELTEKSELLYEKILAEAHKLQKQTPKEDK